MSDVTTRFVLQDEVSSKFTKMTSEAKKAEKAFTSAGKALDNAFKSSAASDFSSKAGQAVKSVESDFTSMAGKLEDSLNGLDEALTVDVGVNDTASGVLGDIEDRASALDGTSADVDIGAADNATPVVSAASDEVENFDGEEATAEVSADDNATPTVSAAKDAAEELDGMFITVDMEAVDYVSPVVLDAEDVLDGFDGGSATAEISVDDEATMPILDAGDYLSGFDGTAATAELVADDEATPVIEDASDAGEAFDGSVWTATVAIVDAATSPITSIIEKLKSPLAQAATTLGVGIGVNDVINTYSDFEATMSQVKALADATDDEMTQLTAKAKEMGAATKYSGTESAEAFTYMAQAGWTSQQMIDGIGGVMSLAASDGIGLAEATDIVANALTSFGLTASDTAHFADVLAEAGAASNTNVTEMGEALKYVAPVAGALNYNIEDTALALGLMSNNGIKGSQAGTSLKTALANLASPTDKMKKAMDAYGISLTDENGNMKSLCAVMENMRDSLGGLDEAEQTAAATTIFGKEAMSGMLSIINASEDSFAGLAEEITNSEGAADRMATTMQDNLAGSLEQLGGSVETLELSWGERMEPYITDISNALQDVMPSIEDAGLKVFDSLDKKYEHLKSEISAMTSSEEWQNADLVGKINIAWDELIAQPFSEWITGDGKHMISEGLTSLFSDAAKILPGGQKASLTSWLSAGLLAKGTTSIISKAKDIVSTLSPIASGIKSITTAAGEASSVGGFISSLGEMVPTAAKFGIAAAAITAAVVGIAAAVDSYNQMQINTSLKQHFGSVELDNSQIQDVATRVIDAEWTVNINAALGHFENAEELAQEAENALNSNDALEWEAKVGVTLSEDDISSYKDNIKTFTTSVENAISEESLAAKMTVDEFDIKMADGSSLGSKIEEWASSDLADVQNLSAGLTNLVENALTDGIIDVDEQAAIDELQGKISNIMAGWQEAEAQAQMDLLTQKYGRMSGADLTEGTFKDVVQALSDQRETATAALEESEKQVYATLNSLNSSGRISDTDLSGYKQQVAVAAKNSEAGMLSNSVNFEANTLSDTYGERLEQNAAKIEEQTSKTFSNLQSYMEGQDYAALTDTLAMGFNSAMTGTNFFSSADQKALSSIYEAMKPDATAMGELIDEYQSLGEAVPQTVMDSFNQAMQIGAAAGDADAAWQVFANQMIADPANSAIVQAIQDGTLNVPEELRTAINRATAETTTDPVTIDGLQADVEDIEVNEDRVNELINTAFEGLEATGETKEIDGGEVAVEYTVTAGQTMTEIAAQAGIALDELIAANPQIENPNVIQVGQKIYIPASAVDVDASEVGAAADAQAQSQAGDTTNIQKAANVTYTAESTDTSQLDAAAQGESEAEPTSTTVPTTITFEVSEINDEQLSGAMTSYLKDQPAVPVTVPVDVTAEKQTDNFSTLSTELSTGFDTQLKSAFGNAFQPTANVEAQQGTDNFSTVAGNFASKFDSALKSAFAQTFTATANASITVNYSIANPTKTISFSGGGSGTATVYAHAMGGYFTEPHMGVVAEAGTPEYVIPDDGGSQNSVSLWQQAGESLGLLNEGPLTVAPTQTASGKNSNSTDSTPQASGTRTIDININGNGKISAGGGLSKDDIVDILMEKVRDVFVDIVQEEALIGGDAAYEY